MARTAGIYLVETSGSRRSVVIADSATLAAEKLARAIAAEAGVGSDVVDPTSYTVGRLGSYDPGIEGAYLVGTAPSVDLAVGRSSLPVGAFDLSDSTERELSRLADPSDDVR